MRRLMAVLLTAAFLLTSGYSSGIVTTMIDNGGCIIRVDLWVVNDPSQPDTGDNVREAPSLTGKVVAGSGKINIRIRVWVDPANCPFCPNDICTYRVTGWYFNRLNQHIASQNMSVTRYNLTSGTYDFAPNWGNQNGGAWEISDNTVSPSLGLGGLRGSIQLHVQALTPCNQHNVYVNQNVSFVGDRTVTVSVDPDPCTISGFFLQADWDSDMWEPDTTCTFEFVPIDWKQNNDYIGPVGYTGNPRDGAEQDFQVTCTNDGGLPDNSSATIRCAAQDAWGIARDTKVVNVE